MEPIMEHMRNLRNSSLPLKKRKFSYEFYYPQIKEELPSCSKALPQTAESRPSISLPLKKRKICYEYKQQESVSQNNNTPSEALPPMNEIGSNKTLVPTKDFDKIEWASASKATRKLLYMVFGRHILASHTLTGKPSPAFKDHHKPLKEMLDPVAVADIISVVTEKCNVPDKTVRQAITTTCADACKLMRLQGNSSLPLKKRKLRYELYNLQIKEELPSCSKALPQTAESRPSISLPLKKRKICNENKQQESVSQNNNTPSEALPPMNEIGANKTLVPTKDFDKIEWSSASKATRKLLYMVFGRHILASHTLTGKPSPAFKNHSKPLKNMLDPVPVADIISVVSEKCNVTDKTVRQAITITCADACKLMRLQGKKGLVEIKKENLVDDEE